MILFSAVLEAACLYYHYRRFLSTVFYLFLHFFISRLPLLPAAFYYYKDYIRALPLNLIAFFNLKAAPLEPFHGVLSPDDSAAFLLKAADFCDG